MIRQTISFYKNFCMITRKKTRLAGVALMCAAAWTAVSCEMNATVDADHEPVLQIDAVFYSDEAMPVIRVRQSFHTARKGGKFLVEKEALEISGADIELLRKDRKSTRLNSSHVAISYA